MWVVGLICIAASAFLLMCLRGFQAALKERRTIWATLIKIEEKDVLGIPHREPQPGSLPKAA
ncbi:MAG TPA: hypothetical protein VI636_16570 [Candidatus Angelobacter sp.]